MGQGARFPREGQDPVSAGLCRPAGRKAPASHEDRGSLALTVRASSPSSPSPGPDQAGKADKPLSITEIFYSLQGEARHSGYPTVFVRLTGCPLRCGYCDTTYAFHGGKPMAVSDILERVGEYDCSRVTVTGGEPLAQRGCPRLLTELCDAGYLVSLETSGALDIAQVDARVERVMDWKTPGSGEVARNRLENIDALTVRDQVKFVLCDRADYDWARAELEKHDMPRRCEILFSPAQGQLNPTDLAEWILADRIEVRMQVQLHKLLWGDEPGR